MDFPHPKITRQKVNIGKIIDAFALYHYDDDNHFILSENFFSLEVSRFTYKHEQPPLSTSLVESHGRELNGNAHWRIHTSSSEQIQVCFVSCSKGLFSLRSQISIISFCDEIEKLTLES